MQSKWLRTTAALGRPLADGGWDALRLRQAEKGAIFRPIFHGSPEPSAEALAGGEGTCLRDARLARLEAVLLMAREPLSSRKLAQFTSLADGTEARTLIRVLSGYYQQQGTAFRIEEVAGGFQLFARPQFGPWLRRLYQSPVQTRLSGPALETLAVVAYRQPVLRADVEAIRGVQSGEILRQLMERDLVRIVGRSPELGRPFLYGTTKHFLRIFGLRHLDDLPRVASLQLSAAHSPPIPLEIPPGRSGDLDTSTLSTHEESDVRITALLEPRPNEMLDRPLDAWPSDAPPATSAAKDEEEDVEDEDDLEDDEDDLEDDEDDYEEDDLEEEEWEEVDDEEEELEDEEEDWEDDEEDDDWDDDEDDWDEDDEE